MPPHGVHWLLVDEFAPADQLGADGHPRRGGFLPPVKLPRRMWAGGRLEFTTPPPIGEPLTRTSTVSSITPKTGSNGPLIFVTVEHLIESAVGPHIREEQDLVYMQVTASGPRRVDSDEASRTAWRTLTVIPDEVMLFRYSALTRNGHRIHYDADYARTIELYPGLVIHGPLTATLLMTFAVRCFGRQPLRRFAFRGRAPLIKGDTLVLKADRESDTALRLSAVTSQGLVGMTATAEL
jgi:3-methylfumaryl-CoA hydratase